MLRQVEDDLIDFCVKQKEQFSFAEWSAAPGTGEQLATVALFLANSNWYGHTQELLQAATNLTNSKSPKFSELARRVGFDCSRFSGRLKARLKHG